VGENGCGFEELDLLVFAEHKLGGFAPVGSVFPAVFDETRRVSVYLKMKRIKQVNQ
jgi:hypothetical protein